MGKVILIVVLIVLAIGYFVYTTQPGWYGYYSKSPDVVCGPGYGTHPGSSTSPDCLRSMWLASGCNTKGTMWHQSLDPSLGATAATEKNPFWMQRPNISDIQKDMNSYYSLSQGGDASHAAACGYGI